MRREEDTCAEVWGTERKQGRKDTRYNGALEEKAIPNTKTGCKTVEASCQKPRRYHVYEQDGCFRTPDGRSYEVFQDSEVLGKSLC